jgi:hypothetical protein
LLKPEPESPLLAFAFAQASSVKQMYKKPAMRQSSTSSTSSSSAAGAKTPSFISVFIHAIGFCFGNAFPSICTDLGRSLAVAALVPGLVLLLGCLVHKEFENKIVQYSIVALFCVISLATLAFLGVVGVISRSQLLNRKDANPSACSIVEKGLRNKRIIRADKYDLYLPPNSGGKKNFSVGFLMLPGALLEHTVYAPVLSQISDAGVLVLVQNCEPIRVASESLGSSAADLQELIGHAAQEYGVTVEKWSIGGHSMGGYTATMIMKKTSFFHSLVLYGVNKSYEIENDDIDALAITASNDGFLKSKYAEMSTFDSWGKKDSTGKLIHVVIEGGNHSGFGDYPRQTFPLLDGERTIPLEEQHRQMVEITSKFLMRKHD